MAGNFGVFCLVVAWPYEHGEAVLHNGARLRRTPYLAREASIASTHKQHHLNASMARLVGESMLDCCWAGVCPGDTFVAVISTSAARRYHLMACCLVPASMLTIAPPMSASMGAVRGSDATCWGGRPST